MKNKHLLILSISPVQSFISQARKTQDMFAGSAILSNIIEFALEKLKDEEIIFPHRKKDETKTKDNDGEGNASNPNRIVVIVEDFTEEKINNINQEIMKKFKDDIVEKIPKTKSNDIIEKQIENFLNINYVAVPYNDEADKEYKEAYKLAEQYLGAVKNTGEFKQLNERGKKCSLCGERNVVFVKNGMKKKFELKTNWNNLNKDEKQQCKSYNNGLFSIKENKLKVSEGLCAVCAGKRFYNESYSFPSTAKIALSNRLKQKDFEKLKDKNQDPQVIFDVLQGKKEEDIKKDYPNFNREEIEKVISDNKLKESKPSSYYALLQFDGDSMGKWLSGIHLKDKNGLKTFHEALSDCLSSFAIEAKTIVDQSGKTVYAGGDDFLGFVNLQYLDTVLQELQKEFDKKVNDELNDKIKDNKKLTFSTSVVIAHYKTPLDKVLKYSRNELKQVKKKYHKIGKNGTAITYITKSNTITTAYYQQKIEESFQKLKILLTDPEKCQKNDDETFKTTKCSSRFFNVFAQEFANFQTELLTYNEYLKLMNMMKSELKRLLKRATDIKGEKEEKVKKFSEIYQTLENLLYAQVIEHRSNCYSLDLGNFINLCNIADKLSRGGDK